mmetsp:Transcript_76122/g.152942  ORF Transcript_76122/g.152942 Transcript_76122/m.152942 type:complete len:215 (-) Transcript_76122:454-1098(-)
MSSELPAGWVEKTSRKQDKKYYFHQTTGETSWSKPKSKADASNSANEVQGGLPEGWDEARTADGRTYYKNHLAKTTQWDFPCSSNKRARSEESSEVVRVRHVLFKHSGSRNPSSWRTENITLSKASATKELELMHKALVESEKGGTTLDFRFAKFAEGRSDCNSGKAGRGGDLGLFGRGKMQPAFEVVAFALCVGGLSGPVDTDSGVHLILRIS